jgi:hypothetical protein
MAAPPAGLPGGARTPAGQPLPPDPGPPPPPADLAAVAAWLDANLRRAAAAGRARDA